MAIRNVEGRI